MWKFGENNWIKYGWGETLSKDWKHGDTFYMDFRNHTLPEYNSSVSDNAKIAVNNIIKSYPPPYTLMCSGGADSQAMIWAWYVSKVPFNIVSIRYISEGVFFNEHDLVALSEYTKLLNLQVDYKNFDVITFLENDLSKYANEYDCSSPQICTHMKMSELIEKGTILFSGNHLRITPESKKTTFKMVEIGYTILGLGRYSEKISTIHRTIIPFFLLHNSKMTISFGISASQSLAKNEGYINAGVPLFIPIEKYTGFEKLKEYYDKYYYRVDAISRLRFKKKPSSRIFDLLFRYPYENSGKKAKIGPEIHLF